MSTQEDLLYSLPGKWILKQVTIFNFFFFPLKMSLITCKTLITHHSVMNMTELHTPGAHANYACSNEVSPLTGILLRPLRASKVYLAMVNQTD